MTRIGSDPFSMIRFAAKSRNETVSEDITPALEAFADEFVLDDADDLVAKDDHEDEALEIAFSDRSLKDAVQMYMTDIQRYSRISPGQVEKLARTIQQGGAEAAQALQQLVQANLRLVISIAKRFAGKEVPFLDLIQQGNIGLMRAAEKFDPDRGVQFSTHATWWIKEEINREFADHTRLIRLPRHKEDIVKRARKMGYNLTQEKGRAPTMAELAEGMAMDMAKLRKLMAISQEMESLDAPFPGKTDDERCLEDLIENERAESSEAAVTREQLKKHLFKALSGLDEREREVLIWRYGLVDGCERTLTEVGQVFDMTAERIRQIEVKALRHLRKSVALNDYVE